MPQICSVVSVYQCKLLAKSYFQFAGLKRFFRKIFQENLESQLKNVNFVQEIEELPRAITLEVFS